TTEGLERTVATNLAGHFVLTNTVAGQMSGDAQIINVSSGGAYTQRIDIDYLEGQKGYDGATMYAQTKRGQLILTQLWSVRLAPIAVHAMHPGWANTPGVEGSLPGFYKVMRPLLRTPDQGADTIVWLAAAAPGEIRSGQFWLDRAPRPFHKLKRTREATGDRAALWDYLEELTAPERPPRRGFTIA
ncbi:MAG: SDR family NAD(P)-dependent oxidoreductase, partial [Acidimicrobiia bacterium]|nr:SDR family NAD(P)-dependent oxidoreductase [Acidimicrobiia bacterium]